MALLEEMELATLLGRIVWVDPIWDRKIKGISCDSRSIKPGFLFIGIKGERHDGRQFVQEAIDRGASALILESDDNQSTEVVGAVPVFYRPKLFQEISKIASRFYGHPSRHLQLIGVTGTNGKTSTTYFIGACLLLLKEKAGIIGTLGSGIFPDLIPGNNTTPDAITLVSTLADFYQKGIKRVAMEVSSHGLVLGRVENLEFNTAIFTNLTRDHLDFHQTMEAYGEAKTRLFKKFGLRYAILNADDPFSHSIGESLDKAVTLIRYGIHHEADLRAEHVRLGPAGIEADLKTPWGNGHLVSQLYGEFNLSNLLAVIAALCAQGIALGSLLSIIPHLKAVPGRMMHYRAKKDFYIIIDYAHTPDALSQVLQALKAHSSAQIKCVFGCGGDRDKGKRSQMAAIAERFADKVIVSSDNPRSEDPEAIMADIRGGFQNPDAVDFILDRQEAIHYALSQAKEKDIILIAGKGHETTQEIAGVKYPYSDEAVIRPFCE